MIQKTLLKISLIIFANLLAFVCIGLILDALFKTDGIALLASVLVSLPVLGIIMYLEAQKNLQELQKQSQK